MASHHQPTAASTPLARALALLLAVGGAAAVTTACSGQIGAVGAITVKGTFAGASASAAGLQPTLLWTVITGSQSSTLVRESSVVQQPSTSGFALRIAQAPESSHLIPCSSETRVGVGAIVVLRDGANQEDVKPADVTWRSQDHYVVYLEHDVAPASACDKFLGAPLSRGYHLMKVVVPTAAEEAAIDACWAAPPGGKLPTEVCPYRGPQFREDPAGFDAVVTVSMGTLGGAPSAG